MTPIYEQETILAMELNRTHVGRLVQIITEEWSITGTLERVDQHDNREWEIIYPSRALVPSGGELWSVLKVGLWQAKLLGNQPVTVERVKGTLEAPERAALGGYYPDGMGEDPPDVIQGELEGLPSTLHDVHLLHPEDAGRFTLCGLRVDGDPGWIPDRLKVTGDALAVTCRECKRRSE